MLLNMSSAPPEPSAETRLPLRTSRLPLLTSRALAAASAADASHEGLRAGGGLAGLCRIGARGGDTASPPLLAGAAFAAVLAAGCEAAGSVGSLAAAEASCLALASRASFLA